MLFHLRPISWYLAHVGSSSTWQNQQNMAQIIALITEIGLQKAFSLCLKGFVAPSHSERGQVLFWEHSCKLWWCPHSDKWGLLLTTACVSLEAAPADVRWLQVVIRLRARSSQFNQSPCLTLRNCTRTYSKEQPSSGKAVRWKQMSNATCLHLSDEGIDVQ